MLWSNHNVLYTWESSGHIFAHCLTHHAHISTHLFIQHLIYTRCCKISFFAFFLETFLLLVGGHPVRLGLNWDAAGGLARSRRTSLTRTLYLDFFGRFTIAAYSYVFRDDLIRTVKQCSDDANMCSLHNYKFTFGCEEPSPESACDGSELCFLERTNIRWWGLGITLLEPRPFIPLSHFWLIRWHEVSMTEQWFHEVPGRGANNHLPVIPTSS